MSLFGSLAVTHVIIDGILNSFALLSLRSQRYTTVKRSVLPLLITDHSLREIKEIVYNNVNSKKLKSIEGLVTVIVAIHNIIQQEERM
jgi:hypothetical protein